MKRLIKSLLYVVVVAVSFGGRVSALEAEILPPGIIVGDDQGLQVRDDGKYFIEHKDIKPGLVFKKEITISNYAQKAGVFQLRLKMEEDKVSGKVNLLQAVNVTLTKKDKQLYIGNLLGEGSPTIKQEGLDLGKYKTGDTDVLVATFTVSDQLPETDWERKNIADFYWVFYATNETEVEPQKPKKPAKKIPFFGKLPQTGEDWRNVLIGMSVGIACLSVYLLLRRKVKKEKNS